MKRPADSKDPGWMHGRYATIDKINFEKCADCGKVSGEYTT